MTAAGQHGEARADVGDDLLAAAARALQVDVDLRRVHAFGVLVELGAPGAAADGLHLRHLQDQALGDEPDAIGLGKRDARPQQHGDRKRSLVEGRQERARQKRRAECSDADRKDRCHHHEGLLPEGPVEQTPVAGLEHAHEPGVAMAQAPHLRQQVVAKDRRQGDRGDEAGQDRDDVGHAQRREQPPLDAGEREQGDEHQDDDGGGVDDARAHLLGRLGDDGKRRRRLRLGPVLAQAPEHVLDADDGVIDQLADGDRESAQRHGVDGEAEQLEHDHRHQHGDRDGRQRNEPSCASSSGTGTGPRQRR